MELWKRSKALGDADIVNASAMSAQTTDADQQYINFEDDCLHTRRRESLKSHQYINFIQLFLKKN
jgi:hypothetical protein